MSGAAVAWVQRYVAPKKHPKTNVNQNCKHQDEDYCEFFRIHWHRVGHTVVMNFGQCLAKLDETSPSICLEKTHRMAETLHPRISDTETGGCLQIFDGNSWNFILFSQILRNIIRSILPADPFETPGIPSVSSRSSKHGRLSR